MRSRRQAYMALLAHQKWGCWAPTAQSPGIRKHGVWQNANAPNMVCSPPPRSALPAVLNKEGCSRPESSRLARRPLPRSRPHQVHSHARQMSHVSREQDQSADRAALAMSGAWQSMLDWGSYSTTVHGNSRALSTSRSSQVGAIPQHALASARPLQTCSA